jgi:hypothetical protein
LQLRWGDEVGCCICVHSHSDSKTTHRFAATHQSIGHGVCMRLSTFRAKATTAMASASDRGGNVRYALFDATGTLMHLKEPVGETYSRYATMHGFDVGSPADLELISARDTTGAGGIAVVGSGLPATAGWAGRRPPVC